MPIDDFSIRQFADELADKPRKFSEEVLTPLARFADRRFGLVATNEYMQDAGATFTERKPPRPPDETGPLRKVSSRLERAVLGSFSDVGGSQNRESQTFINPRTEGILWSKIITVPYASIHEHGGTNVIDIPITQSMQSFFWAKAYETSSSDIIPFDNKWRNFALAAKKKAKFTVTIDIPARPYAEPALRDIEPEVAQKGTELMEEFMETNE